MRISDLKRQSNLASVNTCVEKKVPNKSRQFFGAVKSLGLGLAIYAGSYSTFAYQDMQSLAFDKNRWLVSLPQSAGRTVATASMGVSDPRVTGSIPQPKVTKIEAARLTTKLPEARKPQKINRALKGDRVVSTTIQRPPAHFTSGSVFQRHSFLTPLNGDKKRVAAFVKPKSSGEVFQIASAFHVKTAKKKAKSRNLPVVVASLVRESRSSILGYAPTEKLKTSPFAAVLRKKGPISITPKLNSNDHSWAADPLPKASFSKKQKNCLATGIYFEARGEPARGQAAVAQVILNRVRNPTYPNSICGVVYQNKHKINACQFSFACDRIRDKVNNRRLWKLANHIAGETIAGRIWQPQVGSSTHYHATYVNPKWARHMVKVGKIGLHIFYRTKNGGWG